MYSYPSFAWFKIGKDTEFQKRAKEPCLIALVENGKILRVTLARYNGLAFYEIPSGDACHWATHWCGMPEIGG